MRYTLTPSNTLMCYQKGVGTLAIPGAIVEALERGEETDCKKFLQENSVCPCCVGNFLSDIKTALTWLRSKKLSAVTISPTVNRDVSAGNPPFPR